VEGRAEGWQRKHEHTLPPSVTRVGSASVTSVFLLGGMPRWVGPVGGLRRRPTVRLAKLRPDTLLAPDVQALVPPIEIWYHRVYVRVFLDVQKR
jgi:hypothetical protein